MSEEQNIEDQTTDDSQLPTENQNTSELQTTNHQLQTEEMEVHKHPHHVTHKKKWGEYLLEFFMLFLAVFLGFVAENIRESSVERHSEKAFLKSMVEDLKSDTSNINTFYTIADITIGQIDSLMNLVRRPDRNKYGQTMYYFARVVTTNLGRFILADRAYEEMKSSGSLRLINNEALSDSISKYYAEQNHFKEQAQVQISRMIAYTDVAISLFDGAVFEKMMQRFPRKVIPPNSNPQLLTNDAARINQFIGQLHYFSAAIIINSSFAKQKQQSAVRLIKMIQKKYNLQ